MGSTAAASDEDKNTKRLLHAIRRLAIHEQTWTSPARIKYRTMLVKNGCYDRLMRDLVVIRMREERWNLDDHYDIINTRIAEWYMKEMYPHYTTWLHLSGETAT